MTTDKMLSIWRQQFLVALVLFCASCASSNATSRSYEYGDDITFGFDWSDSPKQTVHEKSDGIIPLPHHDENSFTVELDRNDGAQRVNVSDAGGLVASFHISPTGAFSEGIRVNDSRAGAAKHARAMWSSWVDAFVGKSLPVGKQTILTEEGATRKFDVEQTDDGRVVAVMEETALGSESIVVVSSTYLDPEKGKLASVHRQVFRLIDGERKVLDEQRWTFTHP